MSKAADLWRRLCQKFFKPRSNLKLWQWIDANVVMPRFSQYPGPHNSGLLPYFRGLYDAYEHPRTRFFILAKSAQVGGTVFLQNVVCHDIAEDPAPGLYVTSNEKNAKRFSKQELQPHLRNCRAVREQIINKRTHWSTLEMIFKTCILGLVGSNSPANLASRPVKHLKCDEPDKWPEESKKEAPAYELALARTKTYESSRKVAMVCTPTVPNGTIWTEYLKGSQLKYHVPCRYCGHRQELTFFYTPESGGVRYPDTKDASGVWDIDAAARGARYVCRHCGGEHEEKHKRAMIDAGEWVATNPSAPEEIVSAHICALYSPFETWDGMVRKYLHAIDSAGKLHDFYNNFLGLPWVRHATTVKVSELQEIAATSPEYRRGELPFAPRLLVMTADVQQDKFWWAIRAFAPNKDSALIDYGSAISYPDLDEISRRVYRHDGRDYCVYKVMIDSGYTAKRKAGVYDWCLSQGGRFFPSKGATKSQGLLQTIRETIITHRQAKLILTQYDDEVYLEELYRRRIKERAGPKWWLPRDLTADYFEQLTAERLLEKESATGKKELIWDPEGRPNHLGDAEKMQLVCADGFTAYLRQPIAPEA